MAALLSFSLLSFVTLRGGAGPENLYLIQLILALSRFFFKRRALLDLSVFEEEDAAAWRLRLCEGKCFLNAWTMIPELYNSGAPVILLMKAV